MDLSKIFKAYDIRGIYPAPLDEAVAWRVGFGTGELLLERREGKPGRVVVSRDMRRSSPALLESLIEGIQATGMDVVDLGMCDTSIIYFAVNHLEAAGGVQVTASHNPPEYNGFKISGEQAKPIGEGSGLERIRQIAEASGGPGSVSLTGSYEEMDLWDAYRDHVLRFYRTGRPLKIFIDASNGMAGKLVPNVLGETSDLEIVPLNFEITGSFVHEPNPLVRENMVPTEQGVRQSGADFGACFDGDADRCMIVDDQGRTVGCDHLTALLAGHFLEHESGAPVVYDLRSSKVVEETVRALGGEPCRSRVGHVFMKRNVRESGAPFGGELSGHFYFRDNYCADSGIIALAVIASVVRGQQGSLSQLIDPLRRYPQSGEKNYEVEDKAAVLEHLKATFGAKGRVDELDGVTIDAFESGGWWFNVRASNTEPLLRLNAEGRDAEALAGLLEQLEPMLGKPV